MSEEISVTIPSDPKYLCLLRGVVENMLRCMKFSDIERTRTVLAIDEAVTNIIRHSCGCDPDINIEIALKSRDGELLVEVRDFGDCGKDFDIDMDHSQGMASVSPGGYGINIIKTVMDSVQYRSSPHEGNFLLMRKKVS